MVILPDVHAKQKFFLKDLSAFFESEEARIALRWERDAVRGLIVHTPTNPEDKAWYQNTYIEGFCFAYDTAFYDVKTRRYTIEKFLDDGEAAFGGYDVLILWQPFPRIGIDQRNQFDFWRDMPGGLDGLRDVIDQAHERGVRCLLNYIPWDSSTHEEDRNNEQIMAELVKTVGADGIFGDTMPGFPPEFHEAVARIDPSIVLETESVPPFERMQHLDGVWIQDIVLEPHLVPLPRWISPRTKCFAVNRQLSDRKYLIAWSLFMGMGLVVWENVFGWWNPFHPEEQTLIKRLKPLFQAHVDAFTDPNWEPLKTETPGLYANLWHSGDKIVITLLNTTESDIVGASLYVPEPPGQFGHYDVWNGVVLDTRFSIGNERVAQLVVSIEAQSTGCIVIQPTAMPAPDYAVQSEAGGTILRRPTTPADHLVHQPAPSQSGRRDNMPPEMVLIPAGKFTMQVHDPWVFNQGGCYDFPGNYGNLHRAHAFDLPAYLMDRTEITNTAYQAFLRATKYTPDVLHNFLRHWEKPQGADSPPSTWEPPPGKAQHPVVWVDLNDARAYCQWAGKRLPTEAEWQYAAQGTDGRKWPWGEDFDPTHCNSGSDDTTPVDKYLLGASPFGCLDMSGNVWEWTESERDDGHTRYALLRSGSHFRADGSLWYVASGAQPCNAHQKILLMWPGLDRCGTVGFRTMKDLEETVNMR